MQCSGSTFIELGNLTGSEMVEKEEDDPRAEAQGLLPLYFTTKSTKYTKGLGEDSILRAFSVLHGKKWSRAEAQRRRGKRIQDEFGKNLGCCEGRSPEVEDCEERSAEATP